MKVKIALVQMNCPKGEIKTNLNSIQKYILEAIKHRMDFICFPEMSITGYINPLKMPHAIIGLENEVVKKFIQMTDDNDIVAIAGIVEQNQNRKPFITQIVAYKGKLLGFYRKVNIAEDEKNKFTPGDKISVFKLPKITFGITICADINKEEIFTEYAHQGARIIFEAAAPGLYGPQKTRDWQKKFDWWKDNCKNKIEKYAKNNKLHIAVSTQAGRTVDEDFPGGGYIYDLNGTCIESSDDWSEGVLYGKVHI